MVMRVLMFGWEYAPIVSGGLGVVCRSLTDNLARQDVHVTFVLPKIPSLISTEEVELINASDITITEAMIETIKIPTAMLPYTSNSSYNEAISRILRKKMFASSSADIYGGDLFAEVEKYTMRSAEIAAYVHPDIIHAHDWMTYRTGLAAKVVTGKPLVLHVHATEIDRSGGTPNQEIYDRELEGFLGADRIIAVSQFTKNKITEHYGISPDKISVVHNATNKLEQVETVPIRKTKKEKTVLSLGRLSLQKGLDHLLLAARKVVDVMPDVKFVLVGDGEMMSQLLAQTIELDLTDNVVFAGWLKQNQVDAAYREADLFVMPSISEPFGVVPLEAMRNGTPVLISKQSGSSEVITNCLKVDFWDIDEMANKILGVLQYSELSESMVQEAYKDLEEISWEKQAGEVRRIYEELTNK